MKQGRANLACDVIRMLDLLTPQSTRKNTPYASLTEESSNGSDTTFTGAIFPTPFPS